MTNELDKDKFNKLQDVYSELKKILETYCIDPHTAGYEIAGLIMDAYERGIDEYHDDHDWDDE